MLFAMGAAMSASELRATADAAIKEKEEQAYDSAVELCKHEASNGQPSAAIQLCNKAHEHNVICGYKSIDFNLPQAAFENIIANVAKRLEQDGFVVELPTPERSKDYLRVIVVKWP